MEAVPVWLVDRAKERLARARALGTMLWRSGRWLTIATAALHIVLGLLPLAIMVAVGVLVGATSGVVGQGLDSPDGARALWALAAVGAAFLASGVVGPLSTYTGLALTQRYTMTVHDRVARATASPSSVAALEDPEVAGELAAVEEYDRTGAYANTVRALQTIVNQRTQAVAIFVVLLSFRWWAPLVLLAGWRLVNWAIARWITRGVDLGHDESATGLRRARYWRGLALEAPAAKEVRVFGLTNWVVGQYGEIWLSVMRGLWRARRASWPGLLLAAAGLAASLGVVLGFLASAGLSGAISLAALTIFVQAVMASSTMGPVGDDQWEIGRSLHGARKVLELERRLVGGQASSPPATPATRRGPVAVRIENVRFTYRGRQEPTLDGLSLAVPPGQSLAIVGANGAGKTTLIKLLCGLYEPDEGQILLDGAAGPAASSQRIGVIFQDFVRYELTLRENVGFGSLAHSGDPGELERALHGAGASDLLELLPAGWDSVLAREYDNGADLSGGQWQKVALARALMAVQGGAGLLILDEPTASLDVRAETELFERFLEVTEGVTTILVSHRLSSVRHADRIVVIADGRVVEDGSHERLMADGGHYATMYTLQAERFSTSERPAGQVPPGKPAGEVYEGVRAGA